jgi:hypothetical protein
LLLTSFAEPLCNAKHAAGTAGLHKDGRMPRFDYVVVNADYEDLPDRSVMMDELAWGPRALMVQNLFVC